LAAAAVALVIGLPALAFTLWPLLGGGRRTRTWLPMPPDGREQLVERKRQTLRALRELAFEHEAGHVSDGDYAELRARYEAEAADILQELDRLGPAPVPVPADEVAAAPAARRGWHHPFALGAAGAALVVFGVALGVGIVRYTEPDPMAGLPPTGSRPLAALPAPGEASTPDAGQETARRSLTPEMRQGMLEAARASLFAGRVQEAFMAYRALLEREPDNVDALTHLALIAARIEGHEDDALRLLDRALALDARYPPALLYRGQILYERKRDARGAIEAWEKFLAVAPPGEERQRIERLIAEARAGR
jgi:cytochrome c-type biogenesis protein CcmH/NrfG